MWITLAHSVSAPGIWSSTMSSIAASSSAKPNVPCRIAISIIAQRHERFAVGQALQILPGLKERLMAKSAVWIDGDVVLQRPHGGDSFFTEFSTS